MKQVQAAINAMIEKAMQTPGEPVAMAIVDAAGNLEAYAKLDNLRIFSRRHAQRTDTAEKRASRKSSIRGSLFRKQHPAIPVCGESTILVLSARHKIDHTLAPRIAEIGGWATNPLVTVDPTQ